MYHGPIDQALGDLKSTTNVFTSSFIKDIKGENELDMMEKILEINETFDKLQKSYQELMLQNAETATEAVKAIQERERDIGSSIKQES
ncbi:DUF5344 family protein [Virgibacillus sp. 179-BFC.A HS]|uniref:DUF5344 family protein n=1 Tax=Tigheibacillus jepli TaxID=3035914 RepID=A0ABU5CK66_9BACI|nr:DUF5344 family protein [Virgibacillus sp. 179-BFC.A HS]MDY0406757.1 DUF5344 family protein [Virgibacillus sp. 179-BFC.A HS]